MSGEVLIISIAHDVENLRQSLGGSVFFNLEVRNHSSPLYWLRAGLDTPGAELPKALTCHLMVTRVKGNGKPA
jgi:hypothetical protein